jgi:hypothetical protein
MLSFYGSQAIEGVHPLQGGFLRLKHRTDRRSGLPIEGAVRFYLSYIGETLGKLARVIHLNHTYTRRLKRVEKDISKTRYSDLSLRPASNQDLDQLKIFTINETAKGLADRVRKKAKVCVPQAAE